MRRLPRSRKRLDKWCEKCARPVPRHHEHWGLAERVAWPEVAPPREDEGDE
jgi:hypothetical protein